MNSDEIMHAIQVADTLPASPAHRPSFRDIDQFAATFAGWHNHFDQLDRGSLDASFVIEEADGVQVMEICTNRALLARGTHPPGSYLFTPIWAGNAASVWEGRIHPPGTLCFRRPGEPFDHRTAHRYSSTQVVVGENLLLRTADVLKLDAPSRLLAATGAVWVDQPRCAELLRSFRLALDRMSAPPQAGSIGGVRAAAVECVRVLLNTLSSRCEPGAADVPLARRVQVARVAEEYMLSRWNRPVSVVEVCEVVDVSERTLHYAFHDVFGMSPMAYLKAHRLNRVRRELKAADPQEETVAAVAARNGFTHPGAFAADYYRMFGERPSEAMRKA